MSTYSTDESWGSVTRALHWISAVVIIGLLAHGWWMTHLAERPVRLWHYGMHGLVAIYFCLLLALRIVWRLREPTPRQPAGTPAWQTGAAHGAHWLLYLLLIAMMVTGYMLWSSFPARFNPERAALLEYKLFGVYKMTGLHAVANRDISKWWEDLHERLSHVLMILLAIHIAAALWHQFVKKDNILARMTHGRSS